jgi:16S rRNA C967 or C1407 C5-methylase (RsmB/RsmF family)
VGQKGRVTIYSTCTLNPAENEPLVEKFLEKNDGFKLADAAGDVAKLKQ